MSSDALDSTYYLDEAQALADAAAQGKCDGDGPADVAEVIEDEQHG